MTIEELLEQLGRSTRDVEQALHCLEFEVLETALECRQECIDALSKLDPAMLSDSARATVRAALLDGERIRQHATAQRDSMGGELAEVREARRRLESARSGTPSGRFVSTRA